MLSIKEQPLYIMIFFIILCLGGCSSLSKPAQKGDYASSSPQSRINLSSKYYVTTCRNSVLGKVAKGYVIGVGPTWGGVNTVLINFQPNLDEHKLTEENMETNLSTAAGQAIYSGLLYAVASGSPVYLYCVGNNKFSSIFVGEDW